MLESMDTKGRDYKQLRQGEWYSVLAHVFIHDEVMFRPEGLVLGFASVGQIT